MVSTCVQRVYEWTRKQSRSLSVSVYLYLSLCFSLSVSACLFLSLSFSLSLFLCLSSDTLYLWYVFVLLGVVFGTILRHDQTLWVGAPVFTGNTDNRAFFSSCYINGTYDFLWGVGSAVFVDTTIVGSDNIAAHKGSLVDRNGVLGGCTGSQLLGRSCTAYLMLNCKLPRPKGYRGKSTTLGRCVGLGLGTPTYRF